VLDGGNPYIEDHEKEYGRRGYMTLEFDHDDLFEIVRRRRHTFVGRNPLRRTTQAREVIRWPSVH